MLIVIGANGFSQENSMVLSGKILSSNKAVSNVHIFNLNTRLGTISNDLGVYIINVHLNDTLLFSSIQHKKMHLIVTKEHLNLRRIDVSLILDVNNLEEVFLVGLTGDLDYDIKNKPKDTVPKHNFKYDVSQLKQNPFSPNYVQEEARPDARTMTDPTMAGGVGGSATIPNYQLIAEQKLKRELAKKKKFPEKIIKEFGIDFFTNKLKIPEEKINEFISYCEFRNILEKYYSNKVLEVINILKEESKKFNELSK
jgi:hypothetical protein